MFNVPYITAGETVTFEVTGLESYLGYGTFVVGNMADYFVQQKSPMKKTILLLEP